MLRAEVNWESCQACDPCLARLACKTRAVVKMDADEPAVIDVARCNGCGDCLPACPHEAIALRNAMLPSDVGGRNASRGVTPR